MDRIKILIVDDLEDNRLLLRKSLKRLEDVEFFEAENGERAVEVVKVKEIDIILMDIIMPIMNGYEATKVIKESNPDIVVIVVTASEDSKLESDMVKVGANSYIKKPIDKDYIKYKVKNYISLIRIKRNTKSIFKQESALNPFSKDIRNMKIFYYITNEDDMMDFGTWLIDYYNKFNHTLSITFQKILDFIYKIALYNMEKSSTLTIIIEDGFDEVYINFVTPKDISLGEFKRECLETLGDNLILKDNFIHLRVKLNSLNQLKERELDESKEKIEKIKIDEQDRALLRKSHTSKVSAKEFLAQIEAEIIDEIEDLRDFESSWQDYLDRYELNKERESLIAISDILHRYSSTINSLYSFMALSYALSSLSSLLKNVDLATVDDNSNRKLITLLNAIKSDLSDWRVNIFEDRVAKDIHYLDSSLLSSCMQIESTLTNKSIEDESDLELF